jgi:hypothetical protein
MESAESTQKRDKTGMAVEDESNAIAERKAAKKRINNHSGPESVSMRSLNEIQKIIPSHPMSTSGMLLSLRVVSWGAARRCPMKVSKAIQYWTGCHKIPSILTLAPL